MNSDKTKKEFIYVRLLSGDLVEIEIEEIDENDTEKLKKIIETECEKSDLFLRKHRMKLIKNENQKNEYMVFMDPIVPTFIDYDEENDENKKNITISINSIQKLYDLHDWLYEHSCKQYDSVSLSIRIKNNARNHDIYTQTGRLLSQKCQTKCLIYDSYDFLSDHDISLLRHFHNLYELTVDSLSEKGFGREMVEMIRDEMPYLYSISFPYHIHLDKDWSSLFASTSLQEIRIFYRRTFNSRHIIPNYGYHLEKFKNHLNEWVEWDYLNSENSMIKFTRYNLSKYGSLFDINYIDPFNS